MTTTTSGRDEPTAGPEFTVVDDPDHDRFTLVRDGEVVGFATYRERDGVVTIPHVETFVEHRGQGYAARLMDGILATLRREEKRVVPLCPFAAGHIRDNVEHHDLLA